MSEYRLTEGARRVLRLSENLARANLSAEVEPGHLLWALGLEESRAAEILSAHGLTLDQLAARFPLNETLSILESASPALADRQPMQSEPVPQSDVVNSVVWEAQRQASGIGKYAELGTEHLLWGLVIVDSPAADLLRIHGISPETLAPRLDEEAGAPHVPLEIDFNIEWRDPTAQDHTNTLRILDAAANRAREGLRVVEDFVRFTLDDPHLTRLFKQCRHELSDALRPSSLSGLVAARDTPGDVGTVLGTAAEARRSSPLDVVTANLKRVQEAVRTLEEFSKLISPEVSGPLEQLRYRLYTLEKAVLTTHAGRLRLEGRTLCLLVTETLCRHGSGPAIRESLRAGAGMIQIREKEMSDQRFVAHARRVREWTREAGALLVINDRPDLAVLCDADGVHVGQDDLSVREARQIVGPDRLVGVSTHSIEQARRAVLDGANYLGVGPVFPSTTKSFAQLAGLDFVRQAADEISLPWFAIGGITLENVVDVLAAGAERIAVSQTICAAEQPGKTCQQLLEVLKQAASTDAP